MDNAYHPAVSHHQWWLVQPEPKVTYVYFMCNLRTGLTREYAILKKVDRAVLAASTAPTAAQTVPVEISMPQPIVDMHNRLVAAGKQVPLPTLTSALQRIARGFSAAGTLFNLPYLADSHVNDYLHYHNLPNREMPIHIYLTQRAKGMDDDTAARHALKRKGGN